MYTNFASCYDILTANISYQERAQYFNSLIKKYNKSGNILLDLACGTGTMSKLFYKMGYDVIGVDSSYEMLTQAFSKKGDDDILYICQPMQELDLYGNIDICICALDSINHLTQKEDVAETFNKVSTFLNKGGVFIFDVNSVYKHQKILANNTFVYDCEDVYCVWQNSLYADNIVSINLDLFKEDKNGRYDRQSEDFFERAYSHQEICEFIENANLKLIDCLEGDTLNKANEKSERLVYIVTH